MQRFYRKLSFIVFQLILRLKLAELSQLGDKHISKEEQKNYGKQNNVR